jgi:diguanylate cyclase (GGDEF)-like protein
MIPASLAERFHRALSPSYGARANAKEALEEMAEPEPEVALRAADIALFSGHPAGLSHPRVAGRLGTAVWDVFPAHVALLDRDGVVISVNRAWREFGQSNGLGSTAGLGTNYLEICERGAAEEEPEAAAAAQVVRTALAGQVPSRRVDYPCGGGEEMRFFRLEAIPLPGRHSGALVMHTDITDDWRREAAWQHRALHDPLTGLLNRAALCEELDNALCASQSQPGAFAVLFIDLDCFKKVNDQHGHAVGDRVLVEAGRRMAGSVRSTDTLGRWGGDEFLVIAKDLDGSTTATDVADRIVTGLRPPMTLPHARLAVSASVGVAYMDGTLGADQVVSAAGEALRAVRRSRALVGAAAAGGSAASG